MSSLMRRLGPRDSEKRNYFSIKFVNTFLKNIKANLLGGYNY